MAEITQPSTTGKKRNTKCNKHSTRVDLTPMVDLGFLLITFFIFTTTMASSKALFLPLPDNKVPPDNPLLAAEGKTLQLVLEGRDHIRYFYGTDSAHAQTTDYSASGVRKIIQDKMVQVGLKYGHPEETIVLIQPTAGAVYGNVVDVLDEMLINNVKIYMLLD
jgi:biopolymer transport protein ExbD